MMSLKKFKYQIVDHKRINEILKNIKYKSINATIPENKDPLEITMEEAIILIEKRKEYDKSKKKKK